MKLSVLTLLAALAVTSAKAQNSAADSTETERAILDSLYILEVEEVREPAKLLHAEPLYIDLIRDLGARKGEKEWNVGLGLIDNNNYDKYEALVEYEFAPIDRLGLEIELPFSFYYPTSDNGEAPKADPGLFIPMALGVTFPVNITVGIPVYYLIVQHL
jgi:hypothetical protein